jgi:hypothetical protein
MAIFSTIRLEGQIHRVIITLAATVYAFNPTASRNI